jgi:uncharacterized protein (TIGR00255 family)
MTIASMTGFARAEGHDGPLSWAWELKSVNSKSLDLRFRLPPGYDALELPLRALVTQRLKRGSISVNLSVARAGGTGNIRVNREALAVVIRLANELAAEVEAAPPRIDGLLALRGVLESGDEVPDDATRERQMKQLNEGFGQALEGLASMRLSEGMRLEAVLTERLDEIASLVKDSEAAAGTQPAAIKARVKELIAALIDAVPAMPEERLAHEAALVIAKADVREELDRLYAHIDAARSMMKEGGAIGRRFDFLCQEFNREANTLCSKSSDVALTRVGLDLKAVIEQLREQVQNLE